MPSIRNAFFHPFGPLLWDHLLTSVIKRRGWPAHSKPPVSWCPSWKNLCQCWIVCFAKHSSLYAYRYLSLTKHKNQSPPVVWNECPFFLCLTHRLTHLWIYRDYHHCYTRRTWCHPVCHPVSFERYTLSLHAYVLPNTALFLSFSTVHSPQRLVARRGLSICSYKTRHILPAVSCSKLVLCSFNAYWTTEHDHVWE